MKQKQKKDIFEKARNYEVDKEYLFKRSEKRAWLTAGVFGVLLVISWVGLFLLLPLKEVTPYVVRVDNATGIPDVMTALDKSSVDADEALSRYFANQYVVNREGYTAQNITQTYQQTQLYSSPSVAKSYVEYYKRPDSIDKTMGMGTIDIKVKSIVLETIAGENLATVRLTKTFNYTNTEKATRHYIVKLAYEYKPKMKFQLSQRDMNPLGFIVTSYQIVEENV